jgi:hypothetical protein
VQWEDPQEAGPREVAEAFETLRDHPRFAEAVRACAEHAVALYDANRLLNVVVSDRGRFLLALMALHLHRSTPEGLTPRNLRAACAAYGICSPGRVSAMLALMQWGGYLTPGAGQRLAPTEKFMALHRERWRSQLAAAGLVAPAAAEMAMRLDEPDMLGRFASAQADLFFRGFRPLDFAPAIRFSAERVAGLLMLVDLALRHWRAPAGAPVELSVSDLSRRFSVSRPHVNGVLREAQERGLLRREGELAHVLPPLTEGVTRLFGGGIAANSLCSADALAGR